MSVYEKGLITILAIDLLFVAISVPLLRRKVPPNWAYGYRTPATLSDEALWYDANEFFARQLIGASMVSALLVVLLAASRAVDAELFLPVSLALLVLPAVVAIVRSVRFVSRRVRR